MTAEKKVPKSSTGWREEEASRKHQEPSRTSRNHQEPSRNHQEPSRAVPPSTHVSHPQLSAGVQQLLPDLGPQAVGDVQPGTGGTLLAPELKCRADSPVHHGPHLRRLVHKVEVFPATFWRGERSGVKGRGPKIRDQKVVVVLTSSQPRKRPVRVQVLSNLFPETPEGPGERRHQSHTLKHTSTHSHTQTHTHSLIHTHTHPPTSWLP